MGWKTQTLVAAFALATAGFAAPAFAESEEIIVTASRYVDRYESASIPAVSITRRADAVVMRVMVESDTRDAPTRRREIEQALSDIQRSANATVSVALLDDGPEGDAGETRLRPFSVAKAMQLVGGGSRPDTSRVAILLRTPIGPRDTEDEVEARLNGFVNAVSRPGRVTLSGYDADLTLTDPGQYRAEVIAAIMADGRKALALAGEDHGLRIEGLENRIAWRRSGDLNLLLFVPHKMSITPAQ